MLKKYRVVLMSIILVTGLYSYASAELLGSINFLEGYGSRRVAPTPALDIDVGYCTSTPCKEYDEISPLDRIVFDDLVLSSADIGNEFFATASNGTHPDPGFDDVVDMLTDGINEYLVVRDSFEGSDHPFAWSGHNELEAFEPTFVPDFHGITIESLGLYVNDMFVDSPGENPNGDGHWTNIRYDLDVNVYGNQVPEPATMLLFGAGLVGLAGFGRKRFKK